MCQRRGVKFESAEIEPTVLILKTGDPLEMPKRSLTQGLFTGDFGKAKKRPRNASGVGVRKVIVRVLAPSSVGILLGKEPTTSPQSRVKISCFTKGFVCRQKPLNDLSSVEY